jgi:hypothetical protein
MSKIRLIAFLTLIVALAALAPVTAIAATAPLPGIEGPGGVPHYFGPYGNWAFSPVPKGSIGSITVDAGGTGYTAPTVEVLDAWGTGSGATAEAIIDAAGTITAINVTGNGTGYSAPIVVIKDDVGVDAAATAVLDPTTFGTSGMRKFVDKLPGLGPENANTLATPGRPGGQYIPVAAPEDRTFSGQVADYYEIALES